MTEAVQNGVAADGNGLVLFATAIADTTGPTAAELTAGTTKQITYGLAPDGFDWQTSAAVITTGRFTLAQALELEGVLTDTLEIKYPLNPAAPTAIETALATPGTAGFIVVRLGYPNGTAITAGQKVYVIPIKAGTPRVVPPTANTELMQIQKLYVTGLVQRKVAIAA
jgi:hypothetical protein